MKKTFITPKAEVKAMTSSEMICASVLGVSNEQKGGTEGNPIQAGAKMGGGLSTLSRTAAAQLGKLDF